MGCKFSVALLMLCAGCTSGNWLDDQTVDLGDRLISTEENEPVTYAFQIRNPHRRSLQIKTESVSCGCTTAELDRASIGPGEIARLKFSVDPSNQSRNHTVYTTVRTDDEQRPLIKYTLTWNALSQLSAATTDPVSIEIPKSGTVQSTIDFRGYQQQGSPTATLSVTCADPVVRVLSVTAEPGANRLSGLKEVRYKVLIETTGSSLLSSASQLQWLTASIGGRYECRVPLRIKQELPVKVSPAHVFLRSLESGLGARIALQSSTRFRILEASVTPRKWKYDIALPEDASNTQEIEIRVHGDSVDAGALNGQLHLKLDHTDQPEICVPLNGYLRPSVP
jgi:hypothetical protein